MFVEIMDEYLRTLAEYVYDHDKVVTYKWLSKQLEIHVNVAKNVLWEFWQQHKEDKNIECTILLMGTLKDDSMRVEVVRGKDISTAKEKFKNVISEHLYSIQKSLPDIELLAISGEGDSRFSSIKCNESVERSEDELSALRWGVSDKNSPTVNKRVSEEKKADDKVVVEEKVTHKVPDEQAKVPDKKITNTKKPTGTQKGGFNSLFGKAIEKQNASTSNTGKSTSNTGKSTSPTEKKKASPKNNVSPTGKTQKGTLNTFFAKEKEEKVEKSVNGVESKEPTDTKSLASKPVVSESKKKTTRGKKRQRSKDKEADTKKRKRIIVESESSEDDSRSEDEDMEEDVIPPSPEQAPKVIEKSPSPPRVKLEGGKRKVLKLVDQMTEEDGFIVTKKVHVYESCSEEEMEVGENNKPAQPQPPAEPTAKKNTKQTTLMNFFKKS